MKIFLNAVLLTALAFGFLGSRGIWQPDEGAYVATAVTMQQQNNWMVPQLGESIFLEKPPVMYWGILAGLHLLGHSEFATRAFHGICYLATALVIIVLGRSLYPGKGVGLWAGLMFATMPIPFIAASYITPDMPLTLMTTLALFCFWQSVRPLARHSDLWKILMSIMLGLGFLCKGPAALIPTVGMFAYLLIHRAVRRYFVTPLTWGCLAVFLAVGLWWYVWISIRVPGAAQYFFDNEVWGRLVSDKYQRNPGFVGALIYLPTILLGCLPWSIGWYRLWKEWLGEKLSLDIWRRFRADPAGSFLICWVVFPMLILTLASSKLPLYALPLFPALAIGSSVLWLHNADAQGNLRSGRVKQTVWTVVIWSGLMLLIRWTSAFFPTPNDMRNLWAEIAPHLPAEPYEIITMDHPTDGMIFYGARDIENITLRPHPYPVFTPPETLVFEMGEIKVGQHPYLILSQQAGKLTLIRNVLKQEGIAYREIRLSTTRTLLVCGSTISPRSDDSQTTILR